MHVIDTKFKDLIIILQKKHGDSRGSFRETFIKPSQLARTQQHWTEQEWLKCQPDEKDQKIMNQWLNNKIVLKKQVLAGKKTKPKMERWVRLLNAENTKKLISSRKTKRIQILEI